MDKIDNKFKWKWDFFNFFHGSDFRMLRDVPLFIKFPNNKFGGRKYIEKVTFFDIIFTVNELIDNKLIINNNNGTSLFSLLSNANRNEEKLIIRNVAKRIIFENKV